MGFLYFVSAKIIIFLAALIELVLVIFVLTSYLQKRTKDHGIIRSRSFYCFHATNCSIARARLLPLRTKEQENSKFRILCSAWKACRIIFERYWENFNIWRELYGDEKKKNQHNNKIMLHALKTYKITFVQRIVV